MEAEKFNRVIEQRLKLCQTVLCKKAVEYATDDRLHNFKVAAQILDCTPEKALAGFMCKHTVSVYDLINDLEKGKCATPEMWEEKIGDSLNYLLLLTALLEERFNNQTTIKAESELPISEPEESSFSSKVETCFG